MYSRYIVRLSEFKHCVGYCRKKGKYMTVMILKNKGCLGKQCPYLDKKEHQYWVMRENIKAKKKANKEALAWLGF